MSGGRIRTFLAYAFPPRRSAVVLALLAAAACAEAPVEQRRELIECLCVFAIEEQLPRPVE